MSLSLGSLSKMLKKSNERFVVKSPPIPFAIAVRKGSKIGCQIKITGASRGGRGFGISFNINDSVVFRLFFDTTYKKLHFCKNNDHEALQSLDSTYDFTQLFRLRIYFNNPLLIKIKNGPSFSVEHITDTLEDVNLICIHGNLAIIKTVLLKFIISSDEETAQQYSETQNFPSPPIIQPQYSDPPPSYQHVSQFPVYSGVIVEDKHGHNQHLL